MARALLLTTLALMTAFSGCLDGDSSLETVAEPTPDHAPESSPERAKATAPSPGCRANGNSNNYGIMVNIADDQIKSKEGGLHWYRESNGVRGIQTEAMCPENPDTKVVDEQVW